MHAHVNLLLRLLATDDAPVAPFHALYLAVPVSIFLALQLAFVFAAHKHFLCVGQMAAAENSSVCFALLEFHQQLEG